MDNTSRLAADLRTLTDSLERPGTDLAEILAAVDTNLRQSVDSFLGLSLVMPQQWGPDVRLNAVQPLTGTESIGSSIQVELSSLDGLTRGAQVTFYAAQPGAFVDLAADLARLAGLPPTGVVLDGALDPPAEESSFQDHQDLNVAMGVLIGKGHLPREAQDELERRAAASGDSVTGASREVITSTNERSEADPA